jgi:DNA invertase Pin-like site-specific DNA recombinase
MTTHTPRRAATAPAGPSRRVVTYGRVSTSEQADSGAGLGAQRAAIDVAAKARGWEIVARFEDGGITGSTLDRPGLTEALAMVERGEAGTLAVAKLDRLSRSLMDFAALTERARRKGWALVALDLVPRQATFARLTTWRSSSSCAWRFRHAM